MSERFHGPEREATKCSMYSHTVWVYAAAFVQKYPNVIVDKHQHYIALTDAGFHKDFFFMCVQKFQLSPQRTAFRHLCPPSLSWMERRGEGMKWPLPEGREERSLVTPRPPWVLLASSSQISPPPHIAEVSWDNEYVFLSKGSCNQPMMKLCLPWLWLEPLNWNDHIISCS